ncbi:hypothetical protein LCGC14_2994270 [marine sediment metagenome]|uniref:Uncharacterized protein n=1 Tax=marine sediment metagenome TaxID=412755 RepID=A0A0F8X2Y4_9ZZZZ
MKRFVSTRDTVNGPVWEVWEVCDAQETADFLHVRRAPGGSRSGPQPSVAVKIDLFRPECFQEHLEVLMQRLLVSEEAGSGT